MPDSSKTPRYLEYSVKIIDRWLDTKRFLERIPGLTVGIIYKDEIIFTKAFGFKNLKNKEKMTDDTLFRIASNSKMFTAIAILQLREQSKLSLDDKVVKYLPWLESKNHNKTTIRQLLSHSSGINRDGTTQQWFNDNFPDLEEIKRQAKNGLSVYEPLERFKYSNMGFVLLGAIIAKVSGDSYERYVTKNIISPLNLKNTFPDYEDKIKDKLATGYGRDIPSLDREVFPNPKTKAFVSAAGFVSNVSDLCKFISAQFIGNQLLITDESKREMQRINWVRSDKESYGLGLSIWKDDKRQLLGHGGGFQGFETRTAFDQEEKIGVVVLTNMIDGSSLDLANAIFQAINYFKEHKDDFRRNNLNFKRYEGLFTGRWGDVEIVELDGQLIGFEPNSDKPLEKPYRLKYLKENVFRITECNDIDHIGENIEFQFDSKGNLKGLLFGPNPLTKIKSLDLLKMAR